MYPRFRVGQLSSAVEAHRHEQVAVVHGFFGIRFLLAVEFHRLDRGGHLHAYERLADGAQAFDRSVSRIISIMLCFAGAKSFPILQTATFEARSFLESLPHPV